MGSPATRRVFLAGLAAAGLGTIPAGRTLASLARMNHLVLLGDSTLDNAAYVREGEDVAAQLQELMQPEWRATLLAVDGNVTADVHRQLASVPEDTSHLIVSVGGNDALGHSGILQERSVSIADALDRLADVQESFEERYRAMLDAVHERNLPTAICTIYRAAFPDPALRRIAAAALCVLNDVITREAALRGTALIDLRVIFDGDEDYANAIEPSAVGGRKLAGAIVQLVAEHDFARRRSEVFVTPAFMRR
jgi:hypothetical protein